MSESILGQSIRWTVVSYRHDYDFDRARATGKSARQRVEVPGVTRTGVVWSAGPVAGTAWVIPDERLDGEGYAVCVQVPTTGRPTQRPVDIERSSAYAQRQYVDTRKMRLANGMAVDHLDKGAKDVRRATLADVLAAA